MASVVDSPRVGCRIGAKQLVIAVSLCALAALSGCASNPQPNDPTHSPTVTPQKQVVKVSASSEYCRNTPALVNAGSVTINVIVEGTMPVTVSLYAPKDGQFAKLLFRTGVMRPKHVKSFVLDLNMGAFEFSCEDRYDDIRTRITVV